MNFAYPTQGSIISPFGAARDGGARSHEGVDIGAPQGTPIIAAESGRVTASGWLGSSPGNGVKIDHGNGYQTKYFHTSAQYVSAGQQVTRGQTIAAVGKTGNAATTPPHLHFELWIGGRAVNPVSHLNGSGAASSLSSSFGLPTQIGGMAINPPLVLALLLLVVAIARRG